MAELFWLVSGFVLGLLVSRTRRQQRDRDTPHVHEIDVHDISGPRVQNSPWWKNLTEQERVAWFLDRQGTHDVLTQRSDIYAALQDYEPGTLRAQNKRIGRVVDEMIEKGLVEITHRHDLRNYRLTPTGADLVPVAPPEVTAELR